MRKYTFVLIIFFLFANLADAKDFMSKALNSWVGYTIDDVIAVWGYPKEEKKIAGRNLVYWTYSEPYFSANDYYAVGGQAYCNRILEIDKNKKIISWQYEGNACPNYYFTGKSIVNPKNNEWEIKKQTKKVHRAERKKKK